MLLLYSGPSLPHILGSESTIQPSTKTVKSKTQNLETLTLSQASDQRLTAILHQVHNCYHLERRFLL